MNKEIEKYVGLYLLVYVVVLAFCGFFQYMAVCQGQSLACAFDMEGMNTIITTTAYVLTPIIAIIGFINWKVQYNIQLEKDDLKNIKNSIISLKEIIQYFDVHFRDLYESLENNKIKDFNQILIKYKENKKELHEKRGNLSQITMKYYSFLENSIEYHKEDKELDTLYKRMNIYKWYVDVLIQSFDENQIDSFNHYFELFNLRSQFLINYMKSDIDKFNKKLKI